MGTSKTTFIKRSAPLIGLWVGAAAISPPVAIATAPLIATTIIARDMFYKEPKRKQKRR